ncbi:unnamed protein product [Rotaria magnacalcarata]|uniref:PAW domain-containing protein n=1 Tax=Rotaria magnacalcarata TaxID=392030 RepID=A0A815TGB8_9BILA|nr:unnamed protein product [Rotaria magnacalcarata]CAF1600017.1 unnamed protein product [Rotaria magnacalcarata]
MDNIVLNLDQNEVKSSTDHHQTNVYNQSSVSKSMSTEELSTALKIWNPAFNEFKLGDSPETVSSYLPTPLLPDWLSMPQAFEYRHDLVKYFWLNLSEFGDQITKFIPPNMSVNEACYICFLFFDRKLFHISIRFFHDVTHQNYDKIVEAYARAVNTPVIECEHRKEFYYDDNRIIYFSCFHPERNFTCMTLILKDQTTSTDGHWFGLPYFHDQVPKSFLKPVISPQQYKYDIMISYCHKDKELCHQIYYRLLDSNFRVWIDLQNMYGPVVERMAEAIENTQFVLLCMSDAYKSSAYCQLEAEYGFKFQCILIPLVIKKDFTQTGWLGMLCGLRLYIDFTKTTFDVAYGKLFTEILRYRTQATNKIVSSIHDQQEKEQIIKSQVSDLTSTLCEVKSTNKNELQDRQNVSFAWERNHSKANIISGYIFSVTDEECRNGLFSLKYDSVFDLYYRNGIEEEKALGWVDRVYSHLNIQRKVEHAWHMVYLCRREQGENLSTGSISWLIQLDEELEKKYRFNRITLQYSSVTYDEYARVQWQLCIGEKKIIDIPEESNNSFEYCINEEENYLDDFRLRLIAVLTSSNDHNDNNAWQKAQLFRQSIEHSSHDEQSHCLQINVSIVERQICYF